MIYAVRCVVLVGSLGIKLWPNLGSLRDSRKLGDGLRTFALARTDGGMILSGPNACRGSTNDARILPVFLHSPVAVNLRHLRIATA
jgi:hypothetical protein